MVRVHASRLLRSLPENVDPNSVDLDGVKEAFEEEAETALLRRLSPAFVSVEVVDKNSRTTVDGDGDLSRVFGTVDEVIRDVLESRSWIRKEVTA